MEWDKTTTVGFMQGLTISKHFGCFDMWSSEMNSQDFWGDYLHYTSFMVRSLFHLHWHVKSLGTHETCRIKKTHRSPCHPCACR